MDINNEIIKYYVSDFNKNYDDNVELKRKIEDRGYIIKKGEGSADYKEMLIILLVYLLYTLFFILMGYIFYLMRLYSRNVFITYSTIVISIFLYQLLNRYYWTAEARGQRQAKSSGEGYGKEIVRFILSFFPKKKCPKDCKDKNEDDPELVNDVKYRPTKLDDMHDVWLKGDGRWYGGMNKQDAVVYKCISDDGTDNFRTYIPCDKYIGYKETCRCINGKSLDGKNCC